LFFLGFGEREPTIHDFSRRIAFVTLFLCGNAFAVPFPDELAGPPAYSLLGCSHAKAWTPDYVREVTGLSGRQLERIERRFGYPPERICAADPQLVAGMARNAENPRHRFDEPDKALEQRARQLQDETGSIPPDAMLNALAQRSRLLEPPPGTSAKSFREKAAGLASAAWTWIGPGNIGGRVRAISPNPSTPNDIMIGSVSGGVWRTVNGGTTWSVLNDFMPNVAISCLVRDPLVSTTVFACTGEGAFNIDAVRGLGIFKTTNNGTTWTQLASTNPSTPGSDWYYVNRLAISPTDSQVMLAATNGGLYRTTNGGTSWTKVYQSAGTGRWRRVYDVAFHPTDGTRAVLGEAAHTACLPTCITDGAAVAVSSDGGATWTRTRLNAATITGIFGRTEIAYAKSNPNTIYAVVDMGASPATSPQTYGQLYKSIDGGSTWTLRAQPGHLGAQGWYNNAIWVAPNDENRIILGGVGLRMSLDGGATITPIGNGGHVDHHAFASDPGYGVTNSTLYNGNDGGVYRSLNANVTTGSPTWTTLNNGLGITQFYGAAGKAGGRITGGTQDNGTLLWTGTTNWVRIWGSDGGDSAADQADGNYVYGMTQYGGVVRYTQALAASPPANQSQYICTGISDASCNFNNSAPHILFIPPMALDPSTNTTLYLGAERLWRSNNIKEAVNTSVSWSSVKAARPVNGFGYIPYISAVAIAPGNPQVVWVGYEDGQIACTTNASAGSPTWNVVTGGPARYVTRISYDPTNPNRVFVANGGFCAPGNAACNSSNLMYTTSGCTTTPVWTAIHNQLPAAPVRAIAVHPNNSAWLYAGTEVGVFTSENNGATWSTTNDGPGTVSVEELVFLDPTQLLAATHGRGMFTAAVLPGVAPTFTSAPPPSGSVSVAYTHNYTANGSPAPTFSLASGAFPAGLSLNGTTGVLNGTPTTAGNFSGVVNATNTSGTATQAFSITIQAQLPGAPTIGTATAGNAQATIAFTAPASNGGSPIIDYTVSCSPGPVAATGAASPITVTGLTNNTAYSCSVRARNSAGTGPASGTVNVTPISGITLAMVSARSRKTHGATGDWDILIDTAQPLTGPVTLEPRAIGSGHRIVFQFNDNVSAAGTPTVRDAANAPIPGASAIAVANGANVEVTVTGLSAAVRARIQLAGVNGTLTASAPMAFLLGDVTGSFSVTAADILKTQGRSGTATNATNFTYDIDASGAITLTDVLTVKSQSGLVLP
jgi:hypothetical protein